MPLNKIASRLKQAMGLHSVTVGMVTVSNAISRRMRERGIKDHASYLALLDKNKAEMQELIEAVIIPETWFFRDETPYPQIVNYIRKRLDDGCIPPVNILSAPCSTGEEPYSIAISLDESGINSELFRINAFDISQRNIDKAKEASYRKNSFRSARKDFVSKYFDFDGDRYHLHDEIRNRVNFRQGNILDNAFAKTEGIYDVIFCRNLLIYFDKPTQESVFSTLHKLLKQNGILVLGHAESHHASGNLFEPLGQGLSYIFKKHVPRKIKESKYTATQQSNRSPSKAGSTDNIITKKPFSDVVTEATRNRPTADVQTINTAFELANSGQIEQARELCKACLDKDANNAEAYYLHGVIDDMEGNGEKAEEYMRKAIYLDPGHYKALIHLSLMVEQSGDMVAASRFRQRAQKAQENMDSNRP